MSTIRTSLVVTITLASAALVGCEKKGTARDGATTIEQPTDKPKTDPPTAPDRATLPLEKAANTVETDIKKGAEATQRGLEKAASAVGTGVKKGAEGVRRGADAVEKAVDETLSSTSGRSGSDKPASSKPSAK